MTKIEIEKKKKVSKLSSREKKIERNREGKRREKRRREMKDECSKDYN